MVNYRYVGISDVRLSLDPRSPTLGWVHTVPAINTDYFTVFIMYIYHFYMITLCCLLIQIYLQNAKTCMKSCWLQFMGEGNCHNVRNTLQYYLTNKICTSTVSCCFFMVKMDTNIASKTNYNSKALFLLFERTSSHNTSCWTTMGTGQVSFPVVISIEQYPPINHSHHMQVNALRATAFEVIQSSSHRHCST